MRLVLDTNILVSIYLYGDARHTPLRERYCAGLEPASALLMDAVCYEELAHVLRSARFHGVRTERALDADAVLLTVADEAQWIASAVPQNMPALPICRDPDDQKFLHLAARGNADALLTFDKALLKCRGRVPYAIMRPEEYARWSMKAVKPTSPSNGETRVPPQSKAIAP
jgi:putative PIN family toxin of toxin-antitoxin system